jgi:hypothetical protein
MRQRRSAWQRACLEEHIELGEGLLLVVLVRRQVLLRPRHRAQATFAHAQAAGAAEHVVRLLSDRHLVWGGGASASAGGVGGGAAARGAASAAGARRDVQAQAAIELGSGRAHGGLITSGLAPKSFESTQPART